MSHGAPGACFAFARLALAAAAVVMLPAAPASAFSNDVSEACELSHSLNFRFVGTWPTAAHDAVKDGLNDWNTILDYNGQTLVEAHENSSDAFAVQIVRADLGVGKYGSTNCGLRRIQLTNRPEYETLLRQAARHEIGHMIAMRHTGNDDSMNNDNPPSMSTCDHFENHILSQDDYGQLTFGKTRLGHSALTANPGFEQGTSFWGVTSGSNSYLTSGGATGPGNIRYTGSGAVYQSMRWADAPGKHVRSTINAERNASLDHGSVRVQLYARSVTYAAAVAGDCDYTDGRNWNKTTSIGAWTLRVESVVNVGIGWAVYQSPSWTSFSGGSQDVRVRVVNQMLTSLGTLASVRIDNARVECVSQQYEGDCT